MKDKIVLYSTGCPKCKILKQMLQEHGINFEIIDDVDKMMELGIMQVPQLYDGHNMMGFTQAIQWIVDKSQEVL